MHLQENVPLAPLTTFSVGGPARYFLEAHTPTDVAEAVTFARWHDLPLFVLGGGSNLVIADAGWPGIVLKIAISGIEELPGEQDGKILFDVGAGEAWDDFVAGAIATNCAGVECLSGIPGTVGGTPVQNVGAYGQEVSQSIESVLVFDRQYTEVRELCNEACGFSYRSSIFNTNERERFIIMRVKYALMPGARPFVEYADLKRYFEGRSSTPTSAEVREAVRHIRKSKGMLIVEGDPDSRSAGSFFKNPVVPEEQLQDLKRRAETSSLVIPAYPALAQKHKVSAAWLVEHSGFTRGYSMGRVGISSKHALAIVNRGGASAAEILLLKERIQEKVGETWGVSLEPEPVFVGM